MPGKKKPKDRKKRQRNSEEKQKTLHSFYEELFSHMDDVVFRLSRLGIVEYVSPNVMKFGYEQEELIGYHYKKTTPMFELPRAMQAVSRVLHGQEVRGVELKQIEKSGRIRTFEMSMVPLRRGGEIVGLQGMFRDVAGMRKMREEEHRRALLEAAILGNSTEIVLLTDQAGLVSYITPAVESLLGYRKEEVEQRSVFDFIPEKESEQARAFFYAALAVRGKTDVFELQLRHKNGEMRTLSVIGNNLLHDPDINCFLFSARDVTEKRQSEEESRKLLTAVEQSPASILITDVNASIEYVNPRFCELTGYSREEVIGKNPRILKSGVQSSAFYVELWDTLTAGRTWKGEFCNRKKSGELYWEAASISPVLNEEGELTHYIAVKEDISEQKLNREKLQLSDSILNAVNSVVLVTDTSGEIIYCSPSAEEITGFQPAELMGGGWWKHTFAAAEEAGKVRKRIIRFARRKAPPDKTPYAREIVCKDGSRRWLLWHNSPGPNNTLIGVGHDITGRKKAEEALRESEEKFRNIVEHTHDTVMITSAGGVITYLSPSCRQVLGYEAEDLLGKKPWIIHPQDTEHIAKVFAMALQGKSGANLEYRIITKTKQTKWVNHSWRVIKSDGRVKEVISVVRDVTDRKKAEEALRESEAHLRAIYNSGDAILFSLDRQYRYLSFNANHARTIRKIWGKKIAKGMNMLDIILRPDDRRKAKKNFNKALRGKSFVIEEEYGDERRSRGWWENAYEPLRDEQGRVYGLSVFVRDVTDRKKAEEALIREKEFSETVLSTIPDGMDIVDQDANILYMNESFSRTFGRQALGKKCYEVYRDDKKQCTACPLRRPIRPGQTSILIAEGVLGGRSYEISHTGMRLPDRRKVLLEVFRDVTLQKEYERKLSLSDEILREVGTLVVLTDAEGEVVYCAPSVEQILGYHAHELYGTQWWEKTFTSPEEAEARRQAVMMLPGSEQKTITYSRKIRCGDGREKWILWNDRVSGSGTVISVGYDISERMELERKLREKNRDLEDFFYRISHDLKSPGASIEGLINLMENEIEDENALEYIGLMKKSIARLNNILVDMSQVSSVYRGEIRRQKIDLPELVREVVEGLSPFLHAAEVRIKVIIDQIPVIYSDRGYIISILQNLIQNAVKYRRNLSSVHPEVRISVRTLKEGVQIRVADNGIGMPEDIQPHVFKMFYRGNEASQGTGLGLYIVRHAVDTLGGSISMKSEPNKGTEFRILLPEK